MKTALPALLTSLPLLALGAVNVDLFRFSRAVEGAAPARTEAVAAPLDEALHRFAAAGYVDVRVLDERGTESPCAVEKLLVNETCTVRRPVAARVTALRELPGNRIEAEFVLEGTAERADGFTVDTPLRDFVRAVTVCRRVTGAPWQMLVQDAEICDYSRYLDVRRTEVTLPAGPGQQFKVEIGNATEARIQPLVKLVSQKGGPDAGAEIRTQELLTTPFRMDRISFWRHETVVEKQRAARREWALPAPTVVEHAREKRTEITVETGRLPLNRLVLTSRSKNFSRRVRVQIPVVENGVSQWRDLAEARVQEVDLPGFTRSERELNFPEQRVEKLRVTVVNGDNPPLADVSLRGFGPVYQVVWLADPGRTYRLLYGGENLQAPVYDLDAVLTPIRQGLQPAACTLGAPRENAAYKPARAGCYAWLNKPAFLTGTIILAALALLAVLARSLKRVDAD
ncbi:MAG: hypothetical protein WCI17_02615 [bacterium]